MTETEEKLAQEEYEERLLSNPSTATAGERAATKNPLTDQSSRHTSTVKFNMSGNAAKKGRIARHVDRKRTESKVMMSHWKDVSAACQCKNDEAACHVKKKRRRKRR